jgi:hypothetical protein
MPVYSAAWVISFTCSNLLWGHLSFDLDGAKKIVASPANPNPSVYTFIMLRGRMIWLLDSRPRYDNVLDLLPLEPFDRLVSFANYMGIKQVKNRCCFRYFFTSFFDQSEFESSWGHQLAANTMTSMINGLSPSLHLLISTNFLLFCLYLSSVFFAGLRPLG